MFVTLFVCLNLSLSLVVRLFMFVTKCWLNDSHKVVTTVARIIYDIAWHQLNNIELMTVLYSLTMCKVSTYLQYLSAV